MPNMIKGRTDLMILDYVRYRQKDYVYNSELKPCAVRNQHPMFGHMDMEFEPSHFEEMSQLWDRIQAGDVKLGSPKSEKVTSGQICLKCGQLYLHHGDDKCINCPQKEDKRNNRSKAREANQRFYMPEKACVRCGEQVLRRVTDNVCTTCADIVPGAKGRAKGTSGGTSNRQRSLQAGYKFFIAENPCNTCQCITIRRTANSQCMFCISNSNKLAFEGSAAIIAGLPVSNSLVEGDAENGYQIKA